MRYLPLAQLLPYDGTPDNPKGTEEHPMSFADFQHGMKQWKEGKTDDTFRDGLLVMVVMVALLALLLHLRQRRKRQPELNNAARLGRELARRVPFPWGTRLLLWWVARSTRVHLATLLISAQAFETSVAVWSCRSRWGPLRRWGARRLDKLKQVLFAA